MMGFKTSRRSYTTFFAAASVLLIFMLFSAPLSSADLDSISEWEDHRYNFYGQIFVLNEDTIEYIFTDEMQEELTFFFADRDIEDADEVLYSPDEIEMLQEYSGTTLQLDEAIQLSREFTIIAIKAERPFDQGTSHQRARVDISEVVSIDEGRIIENVRSHHFLVDDKQLIDDNSLRVLPDGSGLITYILPELPTEYLNVEIRSFLDHEFSRQTVTIREDRED